MAKIKPLQPMFETTDGQKFVDEKEANAHQELLEATSEFARAQERFELATINERRTVDGELVELGRWQDYYIVRQRHRQEPYIQKVKIWRDTRWRLDYLTNYSELEVVVFDRDGKVETSFDVKDLYAKEENARAALIEAMEKYIGWIQNDLAKMKDGKWPT